jgi:secreted Zn-dependent insulinase-like peptidase
LLYILPGETPVNNPPNHFLQHDVHQTITTTHLFQMCTEELIAYSADLAGLKFSLDPTRAGLEMGVFGCSHKFSTLLNQVMVVVVLGLNYCLRQLFFLNTFHMQKYEKHTTQQTFRQIHLLFLSRDSKMFSKLALPLVCGRVYERARVGGCDGGEPCP